MLSKKLNAALNTQVVAEFAAAYAYLAVAGHFEREEFAGFAKFFHVQAQEEVGHAMKIFAYIHDAGGEVSLEAIPGPKNSFTSPLAAFELSLHQEQQYSVKISNLYNLALAEQHGATQVFMQWFITEQVEEEALFTRCVKLLKRAGNNPDALLMLDKEFGARQAGGATPAGGPAAT